MILVFPQHFLPSGAPGAFTQGVGGASVWLGILSG